MTISCEQSCQGYWHRGHCTWMYVVLQEVSTGIWENTEKNTWQTSHVPSCWTHFISTRTYEKQDNLFSTPKQLNLEEHIYICIYNNIYIYVYKNRVNGIDMKIQDHLGTQSTLISTTQDDPSHIPFSPSCHEGIADPWDLPNDRQAIGWSTRQITSRSRLSTLEAQPCWLGMPCWRMLGVYSEIFWVSWGHQHCES